MAFVMKTSDLLPLISNSNIRFKVFDKNGKCHVFFNQFDVIDCVIVKLYFHNNGFCDFLDIHVDSDIL